MMNFENIKSYITDFMKIDFIRFSILVISIVLIYLANLESQKIIINDTNTISINTLPDIVITVSFFTLGTSMFIFFMLGVGQDKKKESLSDIQFLNKKKQEYLNKILGTLKLDIGKELKKDLENGNLEDAQEEINGKIKALNKLIDTVRGDNTNALRGTDISSVSAFYESTNSRIRTEIERIKLNANINMVIGVGASIVAIYLLYFTIQNHKVELLDIIPRATISILIEAFAFFFFSQYRKQQEEIKYWNNEKTNLDIKIFALSIAIDDEKIGTKDYMRNLITDLIKTERNIFGTTPHTKEEDKTKENSDDKKLYEDILSKIKDLAELLPKK